MFNKQVDYLLLILLFMLFSAISASAQEPTRQITMSSESFGHYADYIGKGYNYYFSKGEWSSIVNTAPDINNQVYLVSIHYLDPDSGTFWSISFSTQNLGIELKPGFYSNAVRILDFTPQRPGLDTAQPGLDISGDGRGCNELTGDFTLLEAKFDLSNPKMPKLINLVGRFNQYCEDSALVLRGTIYFDAVLPTSDEAPHITKGSYNKKTQTLTLEGVNFDSSDCIIINGTQAMFNPFNRNNNITARQIHLVDINESSNTLNIQIANVEGLISAPYMIVP